MFRSIPNKYTVFLFKILDLLFKQSMIRSQSRQEHQGRF